MENGILVEQKYIDLDQEGFVKISKKKWVPQNVTEYFFFDEYGFLIMNDKKIVECYSEFTETLRVIYDNLKSYYAKFSQKAITEDDLPIIDFPRMPKGLELHGLENLIDKEFNNMHKSPNPKLKKS